ncbi:unnamed protein product [Arabis nemorensis]|uniref:Pectate lyase superfamily protein domain-containing protein n=1 Tax=Arabis nemorensis TaxID=586526 RepID=A0A565CAC4_9BRAS|nr:unnamed protein product [Arabis nemorensis]
MESEKPTVFSAFTRPSWAIFLLLFTVLAILAHQISSNSYLWIPTTTTTREHDDPVTCSGFFNRDPSPNRIVMSITDYGGVGDGKTSNTAAFRRAVQHIRGFSAVGGAQLNVPKGTWLTGSFNLTSNLTLFLEHGAVILGSKDIDEWPIIEPLPSYGRGRERPGGRHISLIHGDNLTNVVITGENGTIDGQGKMWWELWWNRTLVHTRGHLIEIKNSHNILISNLTLLNSPFWTIHPVYCSNVVIRNMTILAPMNAPNTDGIDPDSSTNVCIEDCYIESGDDLVAVKSGWDQYGMAMAHPSSNIIIRRISGTTRTCSGVGIGSEMSGGIFNITIEDIHVWDSAAGLRIKSDKGRGGYISNITINNVLLEKVKVPIRFSRGSNDHPDDKWDPKAIPRVKGIYISNVVSLNSRKAPMLLGVEGASFQDICLRNVTLLGLPETEKWKCKDVSGYAIDVFPLSCPQLLQKKDSISQCP